jgi:hypothetical protein
MGPELAAALIGGSTGLRMAGERRKQKDQREILNRQMTRTNQTVDRTTNQVLGEGQKLSGQNRLQDMLAQENATFGQAQQDMTGAAAGIVPTAGDAGAVSGDFLKAKADRELAEGERLTSIARELSKLRAPGQLMQNESIRRADMQGDIASQWSTTRNMGQAAGMDADAVETPWWGQMGAIGEQIGMMAATHGIGGAGGAASALGSAGGGLRSSKARKGKPGFWNPDGSPVQFGGAT